MRDIYFSRVDKDLPYFLYKNMDIEINWNDQKQVDKFYSLRNKFIKLVDDHYNKGEK